MPGESELQRAVLSGRRQRLSRESWVNAAVEVVARDGFERLSVEGLSAALGATKGSFYWHFADRAALIGAVLTYWEEEATERIIAESGRVQPSERTAALIARVFAASEGDHLERALMSAAKHPEVATVVRRVNQTRIQYVAELLGRDHSLTRARIRARLVYAMYLGELQLSETYEPAPASPAARRAYLEEIQTMCEA